MEKGGRRGEASGISAQNAHYLVQVRRLGGSGSLSTQQGTQKAGKDDDVCTEVHNKP